MTSIMAHQIYSSSGHNDIDHGFQHLIEFNASTSPDETSFANFDSFEGTYESSDHLGAFYRPAAQFSQDYQNAYLFGGNDQMHLNQQSLGVNFEGYSPAPTYHYGVESPQPKNDKFIASSFQHDSPTSTPSTPTELIRKTRSGRTIKSTTSQESKRSDSNMSKADRPSRSRSKPKKPHNDKAPHIDEPLSELTKDLTDIPIRDMEAWVNRSNEERYKEVEKHNGKIARPMNSFMMYRSAYADRTKAWGKQTNHQIVSSVAGESWPLEPPEIREKYTAFADIERLNHAKAFPDYKFSPSKGVSTKRKKDEPSEDESTDESDIGGGDGEWRPRSGRSGNRKSRRGRSQSNRLDQNSKSPLSRFEGPPYEGRSYELYSPQWHGQGIVTPPMGFAGTFEPYGPYSHPSPYTLLSSPQVGQYSMISAPHQTISQDSIHDGIPSSYHPDLFQLPSQHTPEVHDDQIDPDLSHFETLMSEPYIDTTSMFDDPQHSIAPSSHFDDWMDGYRPAA